MTLLVITGIGVSSGMLLVARWIVADVIVWFEG